MKAILIALVAHEVKRAYCASLGDESQKPWADADDWQKQSALKGVEMHLANPDATPEQSHEAWLVDKVAQGWTYGDVKDVEAKKHPCILPYAELPQEQRSKDFLFRAVVHTLKGLPEAVAVGDGTVRAESGRSDVAAQTSPVVGATLCVQYIGRRQEWSDRLYNTGLTFITNQARTLPEHVARQLLRHADLFKEAPQDVGSVDPVPADESKAQPVDDTAVLLAKGKQNQAEKLDAQKQVQDLYDQIDRMDKDGLAQFAMTRYQQTLNKQSKVETLRAKVRGFVDQFGVV